MAAWMATTSCRTTTSTSASPSAPSAASSSRSSATADQKSFADIERDLADYAKKARDGKIKIEDLQGGVFTISATAASTARLLARRSSIRRRAASSACTKSRSARIAEKGQVVIRPMMYLALSYDHRVVDGKEAVTFLVRVKDCIENPARLLLGT